MRIMNNLFALAVTIISIFTTQSVQVSAPSQINIETKIAVVATDTTEGNYIEFVDGSGGWWLESEEEHPNFEVGQVFKCIINNRGTKSIEDDNRLRLDTLEFVG